MPETRRIFKKNGTQFTKAFATTPLCCPSRASIFTGRYAHNHGVKNNESAGVLDQESTVQHYLNRAGYRTAFFGKFFNSWPLGTDPPYFHRWAVFPSSGLVSSGTDWNVNGDVRAVTTYSTDYIADRAVRFLGGSEARDDRPWLMYLSTAAPHVPARPEKDHAEAPVGYWPGNPAVFEKDRSDKPPFVRERSVTLDRIRILRRNQLRSLMSVDDLVERVFGKLKLLNDKKNTLAFFMSDNGFLWGEHGLYAEGSQKRSPYKPSVKLPLFMRWPGRVEAGTTRTRLAANIDVAPTILRAAGLQPDGAYPMDGIPLLGHRSRKRLLLEHYVDLGRIPEWAATYTQAYEYIEYYGDDGLTPTFREYYDLDSDPWQLNNLLADRDPTNDPDIAPIAEQLDADRRCVGAGCP
ncbi:MAG: sulfatase [Actinomycetota bacterium]|nr:sulfatase [Actinomycetota bacterium]